nr:proline-rich protein 36-like [Penaeus vannamei]
MERLALVHAYCFSDHLPPSLLHLRAVPPAAFAVTPLRRRHHCRPSLLPPAPPSPPAIHSLLPPAPPSPPAIIRCCHLRRRHHLPSFAVTTCAAVTTCPSFAVTHLRRRHHLPSFAVATLRRRHHPAAFVVTTCAAVTTCRPPCAAVTTCRPSLLPPAPPSPPAVLACTTLPAPSVTTCRPRCYHLAAVNHPAVLRCSTCACVTTCCPSPLPNLRRRHHLPSFAVTTLRRAPTTCRPLAVTTCAAATTCRPSLLPPAPPSPPTVLRCYHLHRRQPPTVFRLLPPCTAAVTTTCRPRCCCLLAVPEVVLTRARRRVT